MTNEAESIGTQSTERLTLKGSSVGWAAFDAGDYSTALTFFEPWRDDPIGQHFLGLIYLNDPRFLEVRSEGIELLKRSADTNFAFACLALGNYYARGSSGNQDPQLAIYWYTKSAGRGCDRSQFNIGICFCKLEDFVNGTKWLFLSSAAGHIDARKWLVETFKLAPSEQLHEGVLAAYAWLESLRDIDQSQIEPEWSRLLAKNCVDLDIVFADVFDFLTTSLSPSSTCG
jgi:TPR repeat protein